MQRVSQAHRRVATGRRPAPRGPRVSDRTPIRVAAAIIEERGRLLIGRRRPDQPFAGQWEFPGGKIKPSETPRAALRRELREELGAEARIGREIHRLRHRYPGKLAVQVVFFRAALHGAPRNRCFAKIAWVRRGDLPRYDFLAGDRALVARLARGEFRYWRAALGGRS